MFTRLEPPLSNITPKKHVLWPVQLLELMTDLDANKQEAVDSLNLFNDTVLITVMFLPA